MDEEHQDSYDESERNYEQYLKERDELLKRQLSNSQILDKAILALSSAGLGLSLTFIGKGVSLAEAAQAYLLYFSWGLFVAAIISTLISFLTSQGAIKKQLEINEEHYLTDKEDSSNSKNALNQVTILLSYVSVISYILAIILTIIFVAFNPNTNHILTRFC